MIVLELPTPPSLNNIFFNRRVKGRAKTTEYKNWLDQAGWEIRRQRAPLIPGDVKIEAVICKPSNRRMDLDNRAKAMLDALTKFGVIEDDSKVIDLRLRWGDVASCTVTVRAAA